ncbi:MAG: V-type ATP synthase subunit E [Actinomycetia bacterium]|nr:V-type ATP synthase subunit E [Actinomycetes bacterium]
MGSKELFDEIIKSAEKKKHRIINDARKEADQLKKDATLKVNNEKEMLLREAELEEEKEILKITARIEVKYQRLKISAEDDFLLKIKKEVRLRLVKMDDPVKILKMIDEIMERVKKRNIDSVLLYLSNDLSPKSCSEIEKEIKTKYPEIVFSLRVSPEPIIGGFILSAEDGSFLIDYSFDTILKNVFRENRFELSEEFFK